MKLEDGTVVLSGTLSGLGSRDDRACRRHRMGVVAPNANGTAEFEERSARAAPACARTTR